ncbi:uncharacterized protein C2845_PM02G03670 [Panicum miliaceum]|uniref:Uncharacterized protein n=1 Tax=Panicum miliaceum TaxID=4540 RepID=A0A3L6S4R8_PANMI|nr:uncharacterized protein C2845_PM02G03670 [Panicum miliaceum]
MPLGEGAAGMGAGDFALPDEVLAALPRDPYEQLDLARRITAMAVAGRVYSDKASYPKICPLITHHSSPYARSHSENIIHLNFSKANVYHSNTKIDVWCYLTNKSSN